MLELYQAEWCPSSRRVRQYLTELGIDFVACQVPVLGEEAILRHLERSFPEPGDAGAHRARAARMRSRRALGRIDVIPLAS